MVSLTDRSVQATAPSPWPTFAVTAIATYITTLDLSVVNVAFAEIASSFPTASRGHVSWVVTAYSILFGSLLVVSGRVADRIGRKRVFLVGGAGFLLGSFLCAIAPGLGWLIAGRTVQGAGGALLTPASLGLLLAAFPANKRTQMIALNGAIGALGVASGPTLGAVLISAGGWRWAFWVNLPICAVALVLGRRALAETTPQREARPDYVGAALVTVAVAALVLGISEGERWGWNSVGVLTSFALAVALGAAFVVRSRRHPEPMLPAELFAERSFTIANIASFAFGAAFSAMVLNNVLFLRTIWDYSVLRAGLFSVLAPLTVAVVSTQAGKLARRVGFRPLLVAGPLFFLAGEVGAATLLSVDRRAVDRLVAARGAHWHRRRSDHAHARRHLGVASRPHPLRPRRRSEQHVPPGRRLGRCGAGRRRAVDQRRHRRLPSRVVVGRIRRTHRRDHLAAPTGPSGPARMSLAAVSLENCGPNRTMAELPESWTALQGVHGGFVAGLAVRAAQLTLDDPTRALRAATIGFLRGTRVGPCQFDVEVLRLGRALAACAVRVSQDDADVCVARLHFSPPWDGLSFSDVVAPLDAAPPDCVPFEGNGLVRHFTSVDAYLDPATTMFSGAGQARLRAWVRPKGGDVVDAPWLTMLGDYLPPAVFARTEGPSRAVSVEYAVQLHTSALPLHLADGERLTLQAHAFHAAEGFAVEDGHIWAPDGTLLATCRQTRLAG